MQIKDLDRSQVIKWVERRKQKKEKKAIHLVDLS